MGHTKEDFACMMDTLKHSPRHDEQDMSPINMVRAFAEIPALIARNTTYCFELNQEALIRKTANFKKTEVFFDAEGLVVQYLCSKDDRIYTVKVTASKDKHP